ncbi:MAG: Uma2 family endonuclease [Bacteroidia bacterium]
MRELKLQTSVEEYFEIEKECLDIRHEFYKGLVHEKAGENARHNELCGNIMKILKQQIQKRNCKVFTGSLRLEAVNQQSYFYPDVLMTCAPLETVSPTLTIVRSPSLIVEVLSDSTMGFDMNGKMAEYLEISTLQYYLTVSQNEVQVNCYVRTEAGWLVRIYRAMSDVIEMNELDLSLAVATIYEGVEIGNVEETQAP